MGSGSEETVAYPAMSPQETQLLNLQIQEIEQSMGFENALYPIEASLAGYNLTYGPGGQPEFTQMSPDQYYASLTPEEQSQYNLQMASNQQALEYIQGTAPMPAELTQEYGTQQTQLGQQETEALGPGWASSTAGQMSQEELNQQQAATTSAVEHGQETSLAAIGAGEGSSLSNEVSNYLNMLSMPGQGGLAESSALGMPMSEWEQQQQGEFGAESLNAQLAEQWSMANPSFGQRMQSLESPGGGMCCFIMLEAGDLTDKVKTLRNYLYTPDSYVALGYKTMASWLVPIMRDNNTLCQLVKKFVKTFMTHPIAVFCECGNVALKPIGHFWTKGWNLYGRGISITTNS